MRAVAALLLLAAAAAAQQAKGIDRATAAKMAALGDRALKEKQGATAKRIFERAVELDPDQPIARARLGYRRIGNGWKIPKTPPPPEDTDPVAAGRFARELRAEEDRRASAYIRAQLKDHYVELLARLPRNREIHTALGHERIGSRYARPELAAAARLFDEQQARWQQLAAPVRIEPADYENVPGVGMRRAYRVEGLLVSGTLPEDGAREVARTLPAARALLREVFGSDVRTWQGPLLLFCPKDDYGRCVVTLIPAGAERDRALRGGLARTADVAVFNTRTPRSATDLHAHTVAHYSTMDWSCPGTGEGRDWRAYAWFHEGVGYFAPMALFGTGMSYFYGQESTTKRESTVPPPDVHDRQSLLPWLQGEMLDGTTEPLKDVFAKSLNNLDLLLSLEAWSFIEFLAAYDPEGLRRLPDALRSEREGPYPQRSERALEASFGKGLAELEPLWRAFVLEIM